MPELPEVETIVRALRQGGRDGPPLPGRKIHSASLLWERSLAEPAPEEFYRRLPGQTVKDIRRRGKFILLQLDEDALLFHLRMSGDLRVEPGVDDHGKPVEPRPHDRAVLAFEDGLHLAFNDPRKFGRIWLVEQPDSVLHNLGPEPLDPSFTVEEFHRKLSAVHRQVKPLLLDQGFLAGLGNIYTDEALHTAKIHPLQPSDSLTIVQAGDLLLAIRQVLEEGIRRNGASIDWVYRGGDFQNSFRVYQRTGQPCPVCGTPVARIVIGQRGTHFCPTCQSDLGFKVM
jgi:formamidopyrimidine-DNA glycosylase